MAGIYSLSQVTKRYQQRTVIDITEMEIDKGEIVAIVGPSGAGKSTLLRLLNFLETPTTGMIYFQGHPFSAQQSIPLSLRRRVTTVFQRPVLLQRSVAGNVRYGPQLRQRRHQEAAVQDALERVGLAHLATAPAQTLSGGEAQRVALARAMVIEPAVLLLDEPTANLDPHNVKVIEETVQQLNRETGCTVVLVTHNLFQARRLAHRVALMLESQIVEIADAECFFANPQDPRTAAFVRGEMIY
ncbi:MAG TPA: phosphate ABC transporter ATP-binding protein [Caldilineaceae bacterium]|nr:phosphate ABC transporter ATP-binding protein [Caldilineaceae bacterium]